MCGVAMRVGLIVLCLSIVLPACSLVNRDGPDVSCADLRQGEINACEQGIIARCEDGEVTFEVCDDYKACEVPEQLEGAYRCMEFTETK